MRRHSNKASQAARWVISSGILSLLTLIFFQIIAIYESAKRKVTLTYSHNWKIPGNSAIVDVVILNGIITTSLCLVLIAFALSFLSRRLAIASWTLFCLGFAAILFYRYEQGVPLDPLIFLINVSALKFVSTWVFLMTPSLQLTAIVGLPIVALLIKLGFFSLPANLPVTLDWRARTAIVVAAICALLICQTQRGCLRDKSDSSDLFILARSLPALGAKMKLFSTDHYETVTATDYPYYRDERSEQKSAASPRRPNIIMVYLESFSAKLVASNLSNGKPIAPHLRALEKESLAVTHFYSNSIQTVYAYTSGLCGLIPGSTAMIMTDYVDHSFRCLPSILKENGYDTTMLYTYEATWDNLDPFFLKNGIDSILALLPGHLPKPKCGHRAIWGLRDDCIYENVLEMLDQRHLTMKPGLDRPVFVQFITSLTHASFHYPEDEAFPRLIEVTADAEERQINVTALADHYLGQFIRDLRERPYLKDSIVILVGDHSFPAGKNVTGLTGNEIGLSNLHVWTPFILNWPGHLKPMKIEHEAFSHLDIPQTLLDLLDIRTEHSFVGTSMLKKRDLNAPPNVVPVVQPYSGEILGAIEYPYFFKHVLRDSQENIFRIESDPVGEIEIPISTVPSASLARMKEKTRQIIFNDFLLRKDRIFPKKTK